jgi:hypothetical protein
MANADEDQPVPTDIPAAVLEDHAAQGESADAEHPARQAKPRNVLARHKKLTLPLTALAALVTLLVIPLTRYAILGLFLKEEATITVVDSKTDAAVSGARVSFASQTLTTNAAGKASGKLRVGSSTLAVTKQYYASYSVTETVALSKSHNAFKVRLVATGRQVPVLVVNKVTGKALVGAEIKVLDTEAKTDKNGATIVLPTSAATQQGTVQLDGYNTIPITVQVTDQVVTDNTFSLTPAGKLYFLSNLSGKVDVVKTNLDGTERQTVLAGTGKEDPDNTALLASRDWKYLALLSRRAGANASLYLIDTSTDKLATIDAGDANFNLVGWSDHTFVYEVTRNGVQNWQPNARALKSYAAATGKRTVIDQTQGEGSAAYDYGSNNFSAVYILDNELVYAKNWYASPYYPDHLAGKSVSLYSAKPDGSGKKTVRDFPIPAGTQYNYYVDLSLFQPYGIYLQVPAGSPNKYTYYVYEDGSLRPKSDLTNDTFNAAIATYLVSPSDKQTFWSDLRDGKNALFIGDDTAQMPKQIAALSEFTPYGWYSDDYVLVSKKGSELYIMPADGSTPPLKITDYFKSPLSFRGYGGG